MFNKNADIKYYAKLHGVSLKQLANQLDITVNDLYLTKLNKPLTHTEHGELIHSIDLIEIKNLESKNSFIKGVKEISNNKNKSLKGDVVNGC
ncbi:hypothetical protein [Apilactobacillus xinyiensis]|uniref:hypothetical protein n=1 Tax=Apilactobacillus xinyiensis TaxID=2841032 RepID=UPI00200E86DD|nr:hypothetical protein [Apilactobacillus xinyiensis]MCL0330847.1 hypothetical protein [Apilactobacillus xinyiensis]